MMLRGDLMPTEVPTIRAAHEAQEHDPRSDWVFARKMPSPTAMPAWRPNRARIG